MAGLGLLKRLRGSGGDERSFGATAEKLRRQGQPGQAVQVCRDGLDRFPEQLSARVTLGWALIDLQRYEEAKPEFEYVLRRAPDNLQAIRGMAHLHDHVEASELMSLEQMGDWPPRSEDIASAVAGARAAGAADAPAGESAPAWEEADPALPLPVETTSHLLEEAEALDAIAAVAETVEAPEAEPVRLDPSAGVNLEELATELTAGPETAEPDAVLLSEDPEGDSSPDAPEQRALDALEELLTRAQTRRTQVSGDSAA